MNHLAFGQGLRYLRVKWIIVLITVTQAQRDFLGIPKFEALGYPPCVKLILFFDHPNTFLTNQIIGIFEVFAEKIAGL